jgi:DNA-binding transcriptional ArsR family regulator
MSSQGYEAAAGVFQVLSHEARLQILDELRKAEACVCHLQTVLGRPQAYVSQQLRVLRESGLVHDRREGSMVYYQLADPQVEKVLNDVLGPPLGLVSLDDCPCPHCQD